MCKFFCLECGEDERYLCLGCSVIHPKIKAFRNHRVIVINNRTGEITKTEGSIAGGVGKSLLPATSPSLNHEGAISVVDHIYQGFLRFQLYLMQLTDNVRQSSYDSTRFVSSVTQLGGLTLSYFLLVKHLFGRNSTTIHLLLIVGFVLSNYFQQKRFKEEEREVFSSGTAANQSITGKTAHHSLPNPLIGATKTTDILHSFAEEFPDEFAYERKSSGKVKQDKTVSFRPRTRPYVPRKRSGRTRNTDSKEEEYGWDE